MTFDKRSFRDALGCFATGVCIASATGRDGTPVGLTVNSFTSVSLDPPLVLVCIDNRSDSLGAFLEGEGFTVAMLSAEQQELSNRFATARSDQRWDGIAHRVGQSGAPILPDALAVLDCARHATYDGGDHTIVVGRVLDFYRSDAEPLLYFRGGYAALKG